MDDHLPSKTRQLLLDSFSFEREHLFSSVEIVGMKCALCDVLERGCDVSLYIDKSWSANKDGWHCRSTAQTLFYVSINRV